jgi:hypothetical protein
MDGMTYAAKISTNNGHIEINSDSLNDDELNIEGQNQNNNQQKTFSSSLDRDEKAYLSNKFFELGL